MVTSSGGGTNYLSNGQVLTRPPFTARVNNAFDSTIQFFGLYFTTLFSLDPYAAAENSSFATGNNRHQSGLGGNWGKKGGGGGGGGGGFGGGGGGPKRFGGIDDIRAPPAPACGRPGGGCG